MPITFNNPIKACFFLDKKYRAIIQKHKFKQYISY